MKYKFDNFIALLKSKIKPYLVTDARMRIAKGAFWGTIGAITTRSITLLLSFVLARILGKERFGEYGIILSTSAMISGFVGLGIGSTVTRYIAGLKSREPERVGKIIGLSTILTLISAIIFGCVFYFFAPLLALHTLAAPHLTPILQISSITIGLGVINSVQTSTLTGLESFKISSIISTILGIFQSVLVVFFAWKEGVKGAIIALSISSVITVIIYYIISRKELHSVNINVTFRKAWTEWHVLIKYSLPAFLITITVTPVIWASNAFLANQPNGYGQLGIFNAALQWELIVQFLPALFSTAILPVMSDMYGKGDIKGSLNIMWKMMRYISIYVIPLAIVISLLSPIIIKAYGSSFEGGHWVIVIIVFSTVFSTISAQLGNFIAASGKMWIGFGINCSFGVTFLFLSHYFVKWGAEGLATAKLISYCSHLILSLSICNYLSKKEILNDLILKKSNLKN